MKPFLKLIALAVLLPSFALAQAVGVGAPGFQGGSVGSGGGGGGGGDVTLAGDNAFTGNNSFAGTSTFNGLFFYGYPAMTTTVISDTRETEIRTLVASEQESFANPLPDKSVKRVRYIASGGDWTVTYNTAVNAFGYGDISLTGFVVPSGTAVEVAFFGTGGAPYAAAVPLPVILTSGVSGILPIANGGTNASSFASSTGLSYFDGTRLSNSSLLTVDTTTLASTHTMNNLLTTTVAAETLTNTTAATNGAQIQNTPMRVWSSNGWASGSTTSQLVEWSMYGIPFTASSAPGGSLNIGYRVNAGAWSSLGSFGSTGVFSYASVTTTGSAGTTGITANANQFFAWSGGSRMKSATSGQISLLNTGETGFTRLSFGGNTTGFTGIGVSTTTMTFGLGDGTAGGAFVFSGSLKIGSSGTAITQVRRATATLVAGTVAVSDAAVTANSEIYIGTKTVGGTAGAHFISAKTASSGYTITSTSALDTSVVSVLIIEP